MPAQNLLIRPAPVPSIGLAASRAANIRASQAATQGAQTRNLLAEKQLATFDEDRAFQLEQREWARSLRDWEVAKRPQERLEAFGKGLKIYARHSTLQTHDQTIAKLAKAYPGIDTSTIPTAEQIASQAPAGTDPAQYYEQWKIEHPDRKILSVSDLLKKPSSLG